MKEAALRTFFAKHGGGCMVSKMKRRVWQERCHGLCFLQDLVRSVVGDSKNAGARAFARRFLLAPGENRGTGSVRNREGIAEILVPISQSVERQEMKTALVHDNKVHSLKN